MDQEELEQLIKSHGGYIASSLELRHYVHPTNWPELIGAISTQYAVFIAGQSGTGKTTRRISYMKSFARPIPV
jgi:RecA-family ATPase